MEIRILQRPLNKDIKYVLSSFYPTLKLIDNCNYTSRKSISKDEFSVGIWKIKQLKTK